MRGRSMFWVVQHGILREGLSEESVWEMEVTAVVQSGLSRWGKDKEVEFWEIFVKLPVRKYYSWQYSDNFFGWKSFFGELNDQVTLFRLEIKRAGFSGIGRLRYPLWAVSVYLLAREARLLSMTTTTNVWNVYPLPIYSNLCNSLGTQRKVSG